MRAHNWRFSLRARLRYSQRSAAMARPITITINSGYMNGPPSWKKRSTEVNTCMDEVLGMMNSAAPRKLR